VENGTRKTNIDIARDEALAEGFLRKKGILKTFT